MTTQTKPAPSPDSVTELKARIEELEAELAKTTRALEEERADNEELKEELKSGRRPTSPASMSDAQVIAVLLDLHRVTAPPTSGPTLRGGKGTPQSRYLAAALRLGDELADAILPSDKG